MRDDIDSLVKLLSRRGDEGLAEMLTKCYSELRESSTFGSQMHSYLCELIIYYPLELHTQIEDLTNYDYDAIDHCVKLLYPLKDNAPEVKGVRFELDINLKIKRDVHVEIRQELTDEYIKKEYNSCDSRIQQKDYEGAITQSKTLLETVCIKIIEDIENGPVNNSGKLKELYRKTTSLLGMDIEGKPDTPESLKLILSGAINIMDGVERLRNKYSNAHGKGTKEKSYKIDLRHALLAVNISKSITEYLLMTYNKRKGTTK